MFTTGFKIIPSNERMLIMFALDREFEAGIYKSKMFNVEFKIYIDGIMCDLDKLPSRENDRYHYYVTTNVVNLVASCRPEYRGTIVEIVCFIQNTPRNPISDRVTTYRDRWECGPGDLWVPEDRSSKRFKKEFLEVINETSKALYSRGDESVCETLADDNK